MKNRELKKKYTDKELAESFVFRNKLTPNQKEVSDKLLKEMRGKIQSEITPKQLLLSRLLQLKYQIEDYLENPTYDAQRSFGFFLRSYLEMLNKKNYEFANDIGIKEAELSQILNKHRKPSEKIMVRLEIHSNEIIPAITWFKLLEKENEYEFSTNNTLRVSEKEHVRNMVAV